MCTWFSIKDCAMAIKSSVSVGLVFEKLLASVSIPELVLGWKNTSSIFLTRAKQSPVVVAQPDKRLANRNPQKNVLSVGEIKQNAGCLVYSHG